MKVVIWIRPAESGRKVTLRLDTKFETLDTPAIQKYGRDLAAAISKMQERQK